MRKPGFFALFSALVFFLSVQVFAESSCGGKVLTRAGVLVKPEELQKSEQCAYCHYLVDYGAFAAYLRVTAEVVLSNAYAIPGMCCSPFTFEDGMTCRGKMAPYPKDVVVFIPPNFKPSAKSDVIMHLHGRLLGSTFDKTVLDRFQFQNMLKETKRNSILIVPESDDLNATHESEFKPDWKKKPSSRFPAFMEALEAKLKHLGPKDNGSIGSLTLTSHSGAFKAVDGILQQNEDPWFRKIKKVAMFESTYSPVTGDENYPGLIDFTRKHGEKFTSVFLEKKIKDTELGSKYLERDYCAQKKDISEIPVGASKNQAIETCAKNLEKNPGANDPKFVRIKEGDPRVNKPGRSWPHFQAMHAQYAEQLK